MGTQKQESKKSKQEFAMDWAMNKLDNLDTFKNSDKTDKILARLTKEHEDRLDVLRRSRIITQELLNTRVTI